MSQTVSVTLPSAIVYVTGTVNGAEVTFALTGDYTWSATCAVADDGVYDIAITGCDTGGNTSNYDITLYYGLNLILDRTRMDVINNTAKGSYNASDLNRVGAAMVYVNTELMQYGYGSEITPKLDWAMQDIPNATQMAKYLADLDALKTAFTVWSTTPAAPGNMGGLTYTAANNIEQILHDLDELLALMPLSFAYSGEACAGEV